MGTSDTASYSGDHGTKEAPGETVEELVIPPLDHCCTVAGLCVSVRPPGAAVRCSPGNPGSLDMRLSSSATDMYSQVRAPSWHRWHVRLGSCFNGAHLSEEVFEFAYPRHKCFSPLLSVHDNDNMPRKSFWVFWAVGGMYRGLDWPLIEC